MGMLNNGAAADRKGPYPRPPPQDKHVDGALFFYRRPQCGNLHEAEIRWKCAAVALNYMSVCVFVSIFSFVET